MQHDYYGGIDVLTGTKLIPIFIAYDNLPVTSWFCNKDQVMDYFIVWFNFCI